jgi:hypothetical protein
MKSLEDFEAARAIGKFFASVGGYSQAGNLMPFS